MEAKDTVMNDITKRQFIYIKSKADGNLRGFLEDDALESQAEISFKAGIKEVVECIKEHYWHQGSENTWFIYLNPTECKEFFTKWGIK